MSVIGTPRTQGLVTRVINILMRPKVEWEIVATESATTQGLFMGYAAILAAIPAVAQIIHGLMPLCFLGVCYTPNPIFVVISGVLYYVGSLGAVFVVGLIIDALAPSFGAVKNPEQAMKVTVYSWTAAWLAGVFIIVPWFGWLLSLSGFYSLYLLYTGLPVLMKSPPDKTLAYTAVSVVCGVVVAIIVGAVVGAVSTMGQIGGAATTPGGLSGTLHVGNSSVDLNRLQQGVQQIQQQAQAAQQQANGQTPVVTVTPVDVNKMKALLPDTVAGAPRTELSSTSAAGSTLSTAEGTYANADNSVHVTVSITDMGAAQGLVALAGAMNVQKDDETANGYDRVTTVNGQMTTEQYDNPSKSGEYSVVVGNRFEVKAQGSGVPIDTLKSAVNAVGLDRVAALVHG
jgi:hypothetical protein